MSTSARRDPCPSSRQAAARVNRKDDGSRRLSGSDAAKAWTIVDEFKCKQAFVYAMGQEPWMRFVAGLEYTPTSKQLVESAQFIDHCRENGVTAERLLGCRTFGF